MNDVAPYQLPRGVTGFADSDGRAISFDRFKAACYITMIDLGGRVHITSGAYERGLVHGYHAAHVEYAYGKRRLILCNAHHPLVGIAIQDDASLRPMAFVDGEILADALSKDHALCVLSAVLLQTYPADRHLALLAEPELRQLRYWKPAQIGDIIFNDWD